MKKRKNKAAVVLARAKNRKMTKEERKAHSVMMLENRKWRPLKAIK